MCTIVLNKNKIFRFLRNFYKNITFIKLRNEKGELSKKYIFKFLQKKPIIIEAGAHMGTDTCEMARIRPKSTIYSIEPVPELFNELTRRTAKYPNIKCFQMALGERTETSLMNKSSGNSDASSSILDPKEHLKCHPDVLFKEKIEIDVITLKDFCSINHINKVDFLWLDLQGYELNVLKVSEEILRSVKAIYTEVSLIENYSGSALYPELKGWLESAGFKVKKEKIDWMDGGNVLFVKKNKKHNRKIEIEP